MSDDTLHRLYTFGNCDDKEIELLAEYDVEGAESELSRRLALVRLAQLKLEEREKRAAKKAKP